MELIVLLVIISLLQSEVPMSELIVLSLITNCVQLELDPILVIH